MTSRRPSSPRGASSRPGSRPPARTSRGTARAPEDPRLKKSSTRRTLVIGESKRAVSLRFLAIVFFVILAAVIVAPTLSRYLDQQQQLRALGASVAEAEERNRVLEAQVALWNDPAFVESQARQRLGYVMPGQVLYTVSDPHDQTREQELSAREAEIDYNRRAATPWFVSMTDSVSIAGYSEGGSLEPVDPGSTPMPTEKSDNEGEK